MNLKVLNTENSINITDNCIKHMTKLKILNVSEKS